MNEQMKVWAHDYALEMAKQGVPLRSCVQLGWKYAEAMQAQAEQRRAPEPDLRKNKDGDCQHIHTTLNRTECFDCGKVLNPSNSSQLEWQPDWNLAPQGYDWFFKNADGRTGFATQKPHIDLDTSKWMVMGDGCVYECKVDCDLDWRLSLRQRPSSK